MRLLKALWKFTKAVLDEMFMQIFTLIGLFVAWICLTDMAKTVTGWLTFVGTVVYLVYVGIKNSREED